MGDLVWVARPETPMSSVTDIVGKKIGYTSPGSVNNMLILMAMRAQHIDSSQVTLSVDLHRGQQAPGKAGNRAAGDRFV